MGLAALIPCSFLCGILSAVLIWYGGRKTQKTKEVDEVIEKHARLDEQSELD